MAAVVTLQRRRTQGAAHSYLHKEMVLRKQRGYSEYSPVYRLQCSLVGYQEETAAKATALHEMNASHEELKGQNQYIADKLSRLEVPPRPHPLRP